MLFFKESDLNWFSNDEANIDIGVCDQLPRNACSDQVFGRIKAGERLSTHFHKFEADAENVPGYETFFFYQGGKIKLFFGGEEKIFDLDEAFQFTFFSGTEETHSIQNLDDKDVVFHMVSAPKYVDEGVFYTK